MAGRGVADLFSLGEGNAHDVVIADYH